MPIPSLEDRVAVVEKELSDLKRQVQCQKQENAVPWWEKIAGTFANSEEYDKAMRLGREYRESLRPKDVEKNI